MKRLLLAISAMALAGCVSQIFLDGPVEQAAPANDVRVVHVTPVPTPCPESGMGACYLATDGKDGSARLLQGPPAFSITSPARITWSRSPSTVGREIILPFDGS